MIPRSDARTRIPSWLILAVVAAVIVLSRLPQLVASPYLPDGDEALQGVIARHALQGEGIPLFTWGQRYGLSAVETSMTATAFALFGESATALHAGVLVIWCAGALFFVAAVRRLAGTSSSLWVAALLVACPGWLGTSMKAWATSVTAFSLSGLALWAVAHLGDPPPDGTVDAATPDGRRPASTGVRTVFGLLAGIAAVLGAAANALWVVFLGPVLAVVAWRRLSRRDLVVASIAAVGGGVAIAVAISRAHGYWETPIFSHPTPLPSLHDLPRRLWIAFTGSYYLSRAEPPAPVTSMMAVLWSAFTAFVLARSTLRTSDRKADALEAGLVLSLIAGLVLTLAIHPVLFGYRYLLPAVTASCLLIGLTCASSGRAMQLPAALMILALPVMAVEFRHVSSIGYDRTDRAATVPSMDSLLHFLDQQRIRSVYSIESMMQWNLMFSSGGKVTARWLDASDRDARFPRAVDCATAHGERIAVVGRVAQLDSESVTAVRTFNHIYFVLPDPSPEKLARFGFKLNGCS